jgi:hypothetical protein
MGSFILVASSPHQEVLYRIGSRLELACTSCTRDTWHLRDPEATGASRGFVPGAGRRNKAKKFRSWRNSLGVLTFQLATVSPKAPSPPNYDIDSGAFGRSIATQLTHQDDVIHALRAVLTSDRKNVKHVCIMTQVQYVRSILSKCELTLWSMPDFWRVQTFGLGTGVARTSPQCSPSMQSFRQSLVLSIRLKS